MSTGTRSQWVDKVWGKVTTIVPASGYFRADEKRKAHQLMNKGCCTSLHFHDTWNDFIVVSGEVKLLIDFPHRTDGVILTPGFSFRIPAWVPHQLQIVEDAVVIELYGEVMPVITRLTTGKADVLDQIEKEGFNVVT